MQTKHILIAVLGIIPILFSCGKTSTQTLDEMITTGGNLSGAAVSEDMDRKK